MNPIIKNLLSTNDWGIKGVYDLIPKSLISTSPNSPYDYTSILLLFLVHPMKQFKPKLRKQFAFVHEKVYQVPKLSNLPTLLGILTIKQNMSIVL